jgi:parallel beta-helix repeat protein
MLHAVNNAQRGGVYDGHGNNWTVENNDLSAGHGAGLRIEGNNGVYRNNKVHDNGELGITGGGFWSTRIEGNEVYGNNTEDFYTGWESGGMKFGDVTNIVVNANNVHHNKGPGIWCDVGCKNVTFTGNRLHHNWNQGITYEVSDTCLMENNVAYENGWGFTAWVWGAGLQVQNSSNCTVRNNVVAWNADAISVVEQNRGTAYTRGVTVTNNVIAGKDATALLGWVTDVSGSQMYASTSNNRGSSNKYFWTVSGRWEWAGVRSSLSSFNGTLGEENGAQLSKSALDTVLSGKGVNLWPEH